MADHEMILGDALAELPKLASGSVDFILTDPPYGHGNNDGRDLSSVRERALGRGKTDAPRPIANDGAEANGLFRRCLLEFARLLAPGACAAVCGGGGGPDPQFARWALWLGEHLEFKQMVCWDKGPIGMGWHYRRSYETVLVAQKPGAPCRWFDDSGRVENVIRPGTLGIRKIIPSKDDHPTPKPVELAIHFLKLHTREGDLVLDPFAGAGWVGVACKRLSRRFLGVEIDPRWHARAASRIAGVAKGFFNV